MTTIHENARIFLRTLTDHDIGRIHDATMHILSRIGVRFSFPEALAVFQNAGLQVADNKVVRFRPEDVDRALRTTPRQFTRRAIRPGATDVSMGAGQFAMSPGSTVLRVMDLQTGQIRPGSIEDVVDFARLGDALPHFALGNGTIWAQDVAPSVFHALYFEALVKNCGKPTPGGDILSHQIGEDLIELCGIVLGGPEGMRAKKTYAFSACPHNALYWGDAVVAFFHAAKAGLPSHILPTPFAGSMCPVTLAGTLAQMNAEILSCVVLIQLISPGAPVIYAPYCGIMDMRTANHSWGCPEAGLLTAAAGQLGRHYGIPVDGIAGASDSKAPDAQAAYEKMMVVLMSGLGGADCCTLFGGLLELDDYASYEQLMIDHEIAGNILRIIRGINVDDETLALDVIASVGPGGNFLDTDHTFRHFRQQLYTPHIADRGKRGPWVAAGAKDIRERARDAAQQILKKHEPAHLPDDTRRELEKAVRHICAREGVDYTPLRIGPKTGSS